MAADDDGHPIGTAYLRVFTAGGAEHRTEAEVAVHPAERRRGAGTALLAEAVRAARDLGRRSPVAGPVEAGSPGEVFLTARGLRPALGLTYARLDLAGADVTATPAPGYRLVVWEGTVADELAMTFAASRRAMDDMPMDGADVGAEVWDVDRVRAIAAAVERRGETLCTVAAIDEADGTIAGFTELVVPAAATTGAQHPDAGGQPAGTGVDAQHYGTGVLPEHRGRRLAGG